MSGGVLPNAFIVGAQKSGTTALAAHMGEHPDVFVCNPKEPHFFSRNYHLGQEWYERLFAPGESKPVRLEGSTTYTMYPMGGDCAGRIAAAVPDARIIYILRDPVDRIRSAYHHALSTGAEGRELSRAVLFDARYVYTSSYARQLERYLEVFERDQILCLRFEDFNADPAGVIDTTLQFLGLDPGWRPRDLGRRLNESRDRPRAPRSWWRRTRKAAQGLPTPWVDRQLQRLNPSSSMLSRPIRDEEIGMPDLVREVLTRLLEDDLTRLRDLLGPEWAWPSRA